jgi:FKBP-type peptidyl-prolyl cis-trans isomerase
MHQKEKERKRLAQEKAQQLEETLSAARNDGEDSNGKASKKKKKKKKNSTEETTNETEELSKPTSLTRERRLPSGVTVRDLLVGTGAPVKSGKKISLHYTGSLLDNGKVFDKNHSKQHPLVFRQGTGEVIRGLERGLDGMKVGGERIINIPSKLGYGSKGAGDDIPPDSDLTFEVKLLRVG